MPRNNRLTSFLPRAGMIYPTTHYILKKNIRDIRVMIAFERAGFAKPTKGPTREAMRAVDQALAEMFAIAVEPEIINHLTAEDGGLLDLLSALKEATPWARSLGESVFFQFCECLVKARKEWQGNPRLPFDPSQHSQTARSIDNFLREIGDRWNDVEFEIYELVGGWEEDDENNENDSGPSTSNNGLTSGVDINMGDLTTALEDDIEEDNIREGVRRMDINDEM